jgi:hypothetical protein
VVPLPQTLKNLPVLRSVHVTLRRLQQERNVKRTQASYERRAAAAQIRVLEGEELKKAIRQRLSQRQHPIWPKKKGDLHIFVAYPLFNWEFILPEALAPFGRVTAFDWRSRGFDNEAADWLGRRDEMNKTMLRAFHEAAKLQPIDAVVGYLSGANTSPETLQEMASCGPAIFNFCFDDKLYFTRTWGGRYASPAGIAHAVDLNLTNVPVSRIKYAVHGGLSMFFPEAAHPNVHKPYDVPFEFDVSFIGSRYGWRGAFIEKLQRLVRPADITVTCFGRGWPGGPLSDGDLTRLYSRSRINLGFGGVGFSRTVTCLKGRDFEVPMSGGLYLTQDNPELGLVYQVGEEILTYKDEVDCARVIQEIIADPTRADAIRKAGRARCLRDHTYEARWTAPFKVAGLLAE